jgi:alanine racemase
MNWIEVSRKAIVNNYMLHHQRRPGDMIIPVIKSNAYGHGLKQMCEILCIIDECEMVAVDSYPEYLTVYHHCDKQILLIGETEGQNYRYFDTKRTIVGIYNLSTLQTIINLSKPYRIHLFLNTGMNREGIQISDLPRVLDLLRTPHRLVVDGVMSHLANADDHDGQASIQSQVDQFKVMYGMIESAGFHPRLRHINNSSGFIKNTDHWFNAHRVGKGLYGFCEYGDMPEYEAFAHKLQVGVDVYSTVTAIQHLAEGE